LNISGPKKVPIFTETKGHQAQKSMKMQIHIFL
jgi:hypothetical protein